MSFVAVAIGAHQWRMIEDWFSLSLSPQHAWTSSVRLLALAWSSNYAITDLISGSSEWENQEVAGVNGSALLGKKHLNSLLRWLRHWVTPKWKCVRAHANFFPVGRLPQDGVSWISRSGRGVVLHMYYTCLLNLVQSFSTSMNLSEIRNTVSVQVQLRGWTKLCRVHQKCCKDISCKYNILCIVHISI